MKFPSLTKNGISSARAAQICKPQRVQAFLQGRTPGRDRRRDEPNGNRYKQRVERCVNVPQRISLMHRVYGDTEPRQHG